MVNLRTSAVPSAPTTTSGQSPFQGLEEFLSSMPTDACPEMFQGMTKGDMGGVVLSISSRNAKPEVRPAMAPEGLLSPAASISPLVKVVSKLAGRAKVTSPPSTSDSNPKHKKTKNKKSSFWSSVKDWTKQVFGHATKPPSPPPVPVVPLVDVAGLLPVGPSITLPTIAPLARASISAAAPPPAVITTRSVAPASPASRAWLARLGTPPDPSLSYCNGREVVLFSLRARANSVGDTTQPEGDDEKATFAVIAAGRAALLRAFVPCPEGYNNEQWADECGVTALDFANAGKNEDALLAFNSALMSTVDRGLASYLLVQRSIVLGSLDYYAEAIADCGNAIALDPTCTGAVLQMAGLMAGMSRPSDAANRYCDLFKREDQLALDYATSYGFASCPLIPADREVMTSLHASMMQQSKWIATPDHYKMLGMPHDAGITELKLAYRRLALKFHPDKVAATSMCLLLQCTSLSAVSSPECAEVMMRVKHEAGGLFGMIQSAYEQLSNTDCRAYIDRLHFLESKLFELHLRGVNLEEHVSTGFTVVPPSEGPDACFPQADCVVNNAQW